MARRKGQFETYRITVDYGRSLPEMVADGRYDGYINPNYRQMAWPDWWAPDETVDRFPSEGTATLDVHLLHLNRWAEPDEPFEEMEWYDLRPLVIPETLTCGKEHPDLQRRFPLLGLGSVWTDPDGDRLVVCLWGGGSMRGLGLDVCGRGWGSGDRFLAAPK